MGLRGDYLEPVKKVSERQPSCKTFPSSNILQFIIPNERTFHLCDYFVSSSPKILAKLLRLSSRSKRPRIGRIQSLQPLLASFRSAVALSVAHTRKFHLLAATNKWNFWSSCWELVSGTWEDRERTSALPSLVPTTQRAPYRVIDPLEASTASFFPVSSPMQRSMQFTSLHFAWTDILAKFFSPVRGRPRHIARLLAGYI